MRTTNVAIEALKAGMTEKEQELASCEKKYEELSANQVELTGLLDELEAHVENGICPTCSADHQSKATLIQRIHAQKQARPSYVEELAKRRGTLRNALKQNTASFASRTREQSLKNNELQENVKKLSGLRESLALFESKAAKAGLPVDANLAIIAARKIEQEKQALQRSRDTFTRLESELTDTAKRTKMLEQKQVEQEATRKRAAAAIPLLEKQIADLHVKANELDLLLEMTSQELAEETDAATYREAMAGERIGELTSQLEKFTQSVSVVKTRISQVMGMLAVLRQEKARFDSELRLYSEMAAAVIDRDSFTLEGIIEQIRLTTDRVD